MMGVPVGVLQTRFVFAFTFLPLWLMYEYYGWKNLNFPQNFRFEK